MIRARIPVRAHPGAPRNEIVGFTEGILHVKVAAPPVKGRANTALIEFLSDVLGVPKSSIAIIKGHTGPHKLVEIVSMDREQVFRRISRA